MKLNLVLTGVLLSLAFARSMAGTIAIQELSTTTETGDFPVCFNGSGKLLPCNSSVPPVDPPADPYTGSWTGTMIPDPSLDPSECPEADVTMNVIPYSYSSYTHTLQNIVVYPIGKAPNVLPTIAYFDANVGVYYTGRNGVGSRCGTASDYFCPYGNGRYADFTLQFTLNGSASGIWNEQNQPGCYGTWSFTKD